MSLHVERDSDSWNSIVKSSPYAVFYHKYEVLEFGGVHWPLVFEKGSDRILFPYMLDNFLGFRLINVPAHDLASALPTNSSAASLMPEAMDSVANFLQGHSIDLLTMGAPFILSKDCVSFLDSWFRGKKALTRIYFADVLNVNGRSFEEIWEKGFSKHARNRTRKAEREGVEVHEIEFFEDWVSDMHLCNMSSFHRQKRYPRYPHSDREAFLVYLNRHRKLLKGDYRVYGAFHDNRLIAYMATTQFNKLILISLLMSLTQAMPKCPNNALLTHIIRQACEKRFSWIYYSFDRVGHGSSVPSLHSSLRTFKFEHGFTEHPVKVYSLAFTLNGKLLQRLMQLRDYMFVRSAGLPTFTIDALQKLYEMQRYRPSRYTYVREELRDVVA